MCHLRFPECCSYQVSETIVPAQEENTFTFSPIFQIPNPPELRTWYRKRIRHEERLKRGKPSKPPALPQQEHVFTKQNFIKYVNRYLKVAYLLGGFQELNVINLDIVRENAFFDKTLMRGPVADEHENDIYEDEEIELSDEEEEPDSSEDQTKKISLYTKISAWISETFNCNKFKTE